MIIYPWKLLKNMSLIFDKLILIGGCWQISQDLDYQITHAEEIGYREG